MRPTGDLGFVIFRKGGVVENARRAPWRWRLKNALLPGHLRAAFGAWAAPKLAKVLGFTALTADLRLVHKQADGTVTDYGIVSRRVITDTGVAFLVDDWDNDAQNITNMNYHGCGTGTNAENATDSALQTESTTILNPDNTRATGTKSQPTAPQLRSAGTVTFDGAGAITEHGLFNQAATGGGVLWDRSVFSAVNVVSGDSIVFSYTVTFSSGG
jgi:hypothetical protein